MTIGPTRPGRTDRVCCWRSSSLSRKFLSATSRTWLRWQWSGGSTFFCRPGSTLKKCRLRALTIGLS
jgi:hypothetical protein